MPPDTRANRGSVPAARLPPCSATACLPRREAVARAGHKWLVCGHSRHKHEGSLSWQGLARGDLAYGVRFTTLNTSLVPPRLEPSVATHVASAEAPTSKAPTSPLPLPALLLFIEENCTQEMPALLVRQCHLIRRLQSHQCTSLSHAKRLWHGQGTSG